MSAVFYGLGLACLAAAPAAALTGLVLHLERGALARDDVVTALTTAVLLFAASLLLLGLGSILNVLHDIRAELSRANQLWSRDHAVSRPPAEPAPPPRPTVRRLEPV